MDSNSKQILTPSFAATSCCQNQICRQTFSLALPRDQKNPKETPTENKTTTAATIATTKKGNKCYYERIIGDPFG